MARRHADGTVVKPEEIVAAKRPVISDAARQMAEWCGAGSEKKPKKRTTGIGNKAFLKDLDAVAAMVRDDRWDGATGRHFVALYADLHFRVYGVAPADLGTKERAWAAKLANDLLAKEFDSNPAALAEFLAWTWRREKGREEWRRAQGRSGGRIDYRLQFGTRLLVDYRIEKARRKTA